MPRTLHSQPEPHSTLPAPPLLHSPHIRSIYRSFFVPDSSTLLLDAGFISQYPHEKEILFAPLTGLEVRSTRVKGSALVVEVALSVNLASLTIEQVIGKRRALIDQMAEQQVEPVKLRLKEYGKEEEGLARFRKEVAAARKDDPEWYNDDGNFLEGVKGVQRATRLALGVVKEIRLELVKELREKGATHAEVLLEGEDAWIVEDKEWAAAAGSKEELLTCLEADGEGRLAQVDLSAKNMTSLPESVGECKALQTLKLNSCFHLTSLPERLGECKALRNLLLQRCDDLTSLPERLGECEALQTLRLNGCTALASLPDLSGLDDEQLKVNFLPDHLDPWKESGYKAFSVASGGCCAGCNTVLPLDDKAHVATQCSICCKWYCDNEDGYQYCSSTMTYDPAHSYQPVCVACNTAALQ